MCSGLCKCAESVVCCCFSCAWNLFISLVSGIIILLIIIGVIVYFVVYHNKDDNTDKHAMSAETIHRNLTELIKQTVENTKNHLA